MSRRIFLLLYFVVAVCPAMSQAERFRVVCYNVENLYDTCHDDGFDDYEFLPHAERGWNTTRYWAKLGRICRVLAAAGGDAPADVVGLCEVENDTVVRDLCERTRLCRLGYRYVVTKSADSRGLDVALLFQPARFRLLKAETFRPPFDEAYGRPTRGVLHAAGRLLTGDTLDIFLCHLPSRRGGTKAAARYRERVAAFIRRKADSLCSVRCHPAFLLMGDFNDESSDRSITRGLAARPFDNGQVPDPMSLYVLSHRLRASDGIGGTYKYQGRWNQLDQMIVSGNLMSSAFSLHATSGSCRIFAPSFLTEPDAVHGGVKLRRTFLGPIYKGGYSDHLPLILDLFYR